MKSSLLGWEEMLNIDRVFNQFLYELLLFEIILTSEDLMAASLSILGGQRSLKKQKLVQKLRETAKKRPRFCSCLNEFLYILKTSLDNMTSEDVHRNCHDVLEGQDNLKTQKNVEKMSKIAISIYLCNILLSR